MDEVVYIIIIFSLAVVLGIILIFVKKIEKYKNYMYIELVTNSENYFRELSLLEGKYLEIIETHGANIEFSLKK